LLRVKAVKRPWRLNQNEALDIASLRFARLDEEVMPCS
jgi:hypothetical protein